MKIYKAGNSNRKAVGVLFLLQVLFGTLPAILLVVFVLITAPQENGDSLYIWAYISAAAIILCGFAYTILGRRYNILVSGLKGEKLLYKIAKKHKNTYNIFLNLPVRYKHNRSELDMLMIGEKGIIIVEVKNHSGIISGSEKDAEWSQFKQYRDGKCTEGEMKNPLKQLSRQRDILKNILRSNGYDVWIDGVVMFSNPFVRLKINISGDNSYVVSGDKELDEFIDSYECPKKINKEDIPGIIEIIKKMM